MLETGTACGSSIRNWDRLRLAGLHGALEETAKPSPATSRSLACRRAAGGPNAESKQRPAAVLLTPRAARTKAMRSLRKTACLAVLTLRERREALLRGHPFLRQHSRRL